MSYFPSPENYRRNVIDAAAWAAAHRPTLEAIFQAFQTAGVWPDIDALQRQLDRDREPIDLAEELHEMPPSLGGGRPPSPVALTVRGLVEVPQAGTLLDGFMRMIRLAVERYHGNEPKPTVADSDLSTVGISGRDGLLVSQIIFHEAWPFGGGHGDPQGPWSRDIGRDLRYVAGAETIAAYLDIQANLRYGPPPPSQADQPKHESQPASHRSAPKHRSMLAPIDNSPSPGRGGEARPLTEEAFALLTLKALADAEAEELFVEAFQQGERIGARGGHEEYEPPRITDPDRWLMMSLGEAGLWLTLSEPDTVEGPTLDPRLRDQDLLLQILELWHRDVVSQPAIDDQGWEGYFDRAEGQARFRELLAPVLARLDPPLSLHASGQIIQRDDQALAALTDQPLPDTPAADDIRGRVMDAIRRFRQRNVTREEQRLALEQLAGVLETLKHQGRLKHTIFNKDERALFQIANSFGIRHLNGKQQDKYGPALREWIFHAFLASIRLAHQATEPGMDYTEDED